MNIEETKKYIERRMSDVGLGVRIDGSGYQEILKFTNGNGERLNQLYYKLVSVGSRQEKREIDRVTVQIAIDDLRRVDEFMEHMPVKVEQGNRLDVDRVTIEQLASSLDQKVAEEIESSVLEARRKTVPGSDPDVGGNGADRVALHAVAEMGTEGAPGKPRILVVDDSPTIRAAVTKALENDFEFLEATNGEKGWKLLCANSDIKLVVTDLMMPVMDGFGLIERIRSAKVPGISGLPIIVVTALEDPQSKVHALVVGANDFITKSTGALELHARVVARYQLSQIVGNPQYAGGGNGGYSAKESALSPRQIAAAVSGARSANTVDRQQPINSVGAAKRHGKDNQVPSDGFAPQDLQISSRLNGLDRSIKKVERPGFFSMNPTTGITLVASVLVLAAILGMRYGDFLPTKWTTKAREATSAIAAGEAPAPPLANVVPQSASDETVAASGSGEGQSVETSGVSSWSTADGAPTREQLGPAPAETPADKAPAAITTVAAAKPAQPPRQPAAVTEAKPPAIPARASRNSTSTLTTAATKSRLNVKTVPPPQPAQTPESESVAAGVENPPPATLAETSGAVPTDVVPSATPFAAAPAVEPPTASSDIVPESQVAIARPPRTDLGSAPSTQLTQAELSSLVKRFVFVYQAGDIEQFLSLFDDNIRTNDRATKAGLRKDYEELFRGTSMRQMILGDITWDIKDRQADCVANFEVRIRGVNESELKVYQGSLSFHVEKIGGRARITRMYHGQWKT